MNDDAIVCFSGVGSIRGLQHYELSLFRQREFIVSSSSVADAAPMQSAFCQLIERLFAEQLLHGDVRAFTKEGRMTISVLRLHNELNLGIALDATELRANAIRLASLMQMSLTTGTCASLMSQSKYERLEAGPIAIHQGLVMC